MKQGRLQFRHYESIFDTREKAYKYIQDIVNSAYAEANRLDESLMAEPIVVVYKDADEKLKVLLCVGVEGEKGDGTLKPYHIIDSAKLEEDIAELSGSTGHLYELIEALQAEADAIEAGAGLNEDGTYTPNDESTYIKEATSLKDADNKLDAELARVEKARKDVTGQETDVYVPNQSLTIRPIAYIADAESLNDADVKLDQALQALNAETVKNIVVNDVTGTVVDNIASVTIDADDINIGEYENYHGKATKPHPIHDDYSVLDAVKQLDLNLLDFTEKEEEALNGLHVVRVTEGLAANVKEAYDLVNKDGLVQENSDRIFIYKDSSLYRVYLGHVDDSITSYEDPTVIPGTGDTALCFIYLRTDGLYELVAVNVESFLQESEFLDGLRTDNHKVYVKIDEHSENFLTVGPDGVKLSGVQDAIDSAKSEEENRARAAETTLQDNIDYEEARAQGAEQIISNAVAAFSSATMGEVSRLDDKIDAEEARAEAEEGIINGKVNSLSSATVSEIARIDATATRNKVKSTGHTINISEATEGTNLDVNIDGKTILSNGGVLGTGIKIVEVPASQLEANVREAFKLVDNEGHDINNTIIKIYKSSSLLSVQLVNIGGIDYVRITYIDNEGQTQTMDLNIQELIFEAEFKDGLTVNGAGEVRVKIDNSSEQFLTVSESGVKLSGVQDAINNAKADEEARAEAAEAAITSTVNSLSASTVSEIARLDAKVETETLRAQSAEGTLQDNIDAEEARATNAEESLDGRLDAIEAVTVSGEKAINVSAVGATESKLITLVLDADNVLTQSNNGLRTNLSLNYDSANQKVQLVGVGGTVISEFDSSDFVKDGMIQSVVFDPATQKLTITWNTAAGHDSTIIDLSSLVDVYTVESNSQKYLAINNYVLSAKVNVTNGLAGYDKLVELSGNVETLESSWETPGSYKHTISDSMITSPTAGSAIDAHNTLLRHYIEGGEKKYYASNNAYDMAYNGERLSTVIAGILTDAENLSGATASEVARLDSKIDAETERATAAENSISGVVNTFSAATNNEINTLKAQLEEASGTIETLQLQLSELSGTVQSMQENMLTNVYTAVKAILEGAGREIKITADDTGKKITIGFADDAIFGPISLG